MSHAAFATIAVPAGASASALALARGLAGERASVITGDAGDGPDLLVLDRDHHSHRGLTDVPCAAALVPPGWSWPGPPRHVGVAYDGSPSAEAALDLGCALAAEHEAALSVYFAVAAAPARVGAASDTAAGPSPVQAAYAALEAAAARCLDGVNPELCVLRGEATAAITAEADRIVDLMIVGSRRPGPVRRALLGSTSAALAARSSCPVVVAATEG